MALVAEIERMEARQEWAAQASNATATQGRVDTSSTALSDGVERRRAERAALRESAAALAQASLERGRGGRLGRVVRRLLRAAAHATVAVCRAIVRALHKLLHH